MSIIDTFQIFLNSKNADQQLDGFTSDCVFHLPPFELPKKYKYYISVQNAVIPYSFLNCDYYNNKLVYSINGEADITLVIPEGNYNTSTLRTYLLTVMTGFTISYNSISNRYTFTSGSNFIFKSSSSCFELLGFTDDLEHSSSSLSLTSNISINFFTIRNIYIQSSNIILNNLNHSNPNNASILCSIPVSSSSFSVINYSNVNNIRMAIDGITNFSNLNITLTDQDGDIIDLNGCHFSITLQIDIKQK